MSRINHFSETKQFCLSNITLLNGDPLIICVTPSKVVIQKSRLGWWGRKLYEEKDMHRVAMTKVDPFVKTKNHWIFNSCGK